MTDAVFLGVIVISAIEGFVGGTMLYFFKVESFIFWGLVMSICAILPLLGINTILVSFCHLSDYLRQLHMGDCNALRWIRWKYDQPKHYQT